VFLTLSLNLCNLRNLRMNLLFPGKGRSMSEPENRRQFERHACDVALDSVRAAHEGAPRESFRCRAVNASEGGLMIESETPLAVGQRLVLRLRGADRSRVVDAEAEVLWAKSGTGVHRAGVRYVRRREEFVV
jgi:hypothetical protein